MGPPLWKIFWQVFFFPPIFSLIKLKRRCLASAEDPGDRVHSFGQKIPWRSKWQAASIFLPGKSRGQRSLLGYSPRARKQTWLSPVAQLPHSKKHSTKVKGRGVGMENNNFRPRRLTNTSCSQGGKINLNSNSYNDTSYLPNDVMKMALQLCGPSS